MLTARKRWGTFLWALGAGIGAALCGQLMQPLHLLTHEFVQGFSVAAALALLALGRANAGRAEGLFDTVGVAAMLGLGAFSAHVVIDPFVYGCRFHAAPFFFWATYLPLALLGAVAGTLAGHAGWSARRTVAVTLAIVLASVLHDVAQGVLGLRVVDPLIGEPLAFDQRAGMAPTVVHLYERAWLLVATWALWCRGRARFHPGAEQTLWARGSIAVLLLLTLGGGSHLGLGIGRSAQHTSLDAVIHTEHFDVRYRSTGRASVFAQTIAQEAEWDLHRLTQRWGVQPRMRIDLRLYDGNDHIQRVTGAGNARGGLYWIDMPWWKGFTDTLPHELVHAMHAELWPHPQILLSRGFLEGTAVAWSEGLTVDPGAHAPIAGALRSGTLPPASALLGTMGFRTMREHIAYDAAGSFLGYLVFAHGFEPFLTLTRTLDFERAYGASLDELDQAWRTFLKDEVPLDLATWAQSRETYDPVLWPGYLERKCPKLGGHREGTREVAKRRFDNWDLRGALTLYEQLYEKKPGVRWGYQVALTRQLLADNAGALRVVEALLADPEVQPDQRENLLRLGLVSHLALSDWPAVEADMAARALLRDEVSKDAVQLESALRNPEVRQAVADAILLGQTPKSAYALRKLLAENPDDAALKHLVATRALLLPGDERSLTFPTVDRARIAEAIALIDQVDGACDANADRLVGLAMRGARGADPALGRRMAEQVLDRCTDGVIRWRAGRVLDRLAFTGD
jgi:hypothetical protein